MKVVETRESHKLLANIFSAIGLDFDKNFGKWSLCLEHCYLLRIQYKHTVTFLVEIGS